MQTTTGSEERILALLRNANNRLLAHPESRRRLLQLKAPAVLVPYQGGHTGGAGLSGRCPAAAVRRGACCTACNQPPSTCAGVRMVEDDVSIVPFSDAYDTHCARYGREADGPILAFKARCCTPEGITADAKARLEAYQEVVERGVTENIFSQFMYKTMVENNLSMWVIKKQFALSAAMSGGCAPACRHVGGGRGGSGMAGPPLVASQACLLGGAARTPALSAPTPSHHT